MTSLPLLQRVSRTLFFARESTNRRKVTVSIAALALTTLITVAGRSQLAAWAIQRSATVGQSVPVVVQAVALREETVTAGLRYSGLVQELRKVELSFRVPGTVEELLQVEGPGGILRDLHEGDTLPLGTLLARLDTADYQRDRALAAQRLATAEARLAQSESDRQLARRDLDRIDQLRQKKVVSDADHDAAQSRLKSTAAAQQAVEREVEAARIQLEQADANLRYCELTVPFPAATVAARRIDRQQRVAAHQPAFLLLDLSSVVIRFSVPDSLVGRLQIGQPLEVTADALPGETFPGAIHMIASKADPQTRTYAIEVRIDQPGGLKPGMVASVQFRTPSTAHLLPLSAIAPGAARGQFVVYRIRTDEGGATVEEVPVESDAVLDNQFAVRLTAESPLRPGDRVVKLATHRLHNGQAVRVAD